MKNMGILVRKHGLNKKKSNSVLNGEVILKPAEEKHGKVTFLGA